MNVHGGPEAVTAEGPHARPTVGELTAALREALEYLWSDLAAAYRYSQATPPERSVGFESLVTRIHTITRLIGPVSPDQIELPFLLTGMYEQVHAAAGIVVTVPGDLLAAARERE